jgi:hypothetical protein
MSMSFLANGNIYPSRFVKNDTSTTGGYIIMAGSGDRTIGVSQPGVRQPPISGLDDGYAGVQNVNQVEVATEKDETWLELGGTVTYGDYLKASTNGVGVTAGSDTDQYGAQALQSGKSGDLIRVLVIIGYHA